MSQSTSALFLACALVLTSTACPKPIDPLAEKKKVQAKAEEKRHTRAQKRPPFPNMATSVWGKIVIETAAKKGDGKLSGQGKDVAYAAAKRALHSRENGSEVNLVDAAAAFWRAAEDDGDRALAASLMGVGLVLNPNIEGYRTRLIDAAGLAAYSGSLRGGTVIAQAGQALITIAIGRVHAGKQLIDMLGSDIKQSEKLDAEASLLLANARFLRGQRDDGFFRDITRTIRLAPLSTRARALKARALLDLGFGRRAAEIATAVDVTTPYLEAIGAAGLGSAGKRDFAIERIHMAESRIREPERAEVLYWLAMLLASQPSGVDEAKEIAGKLESRPGFVAEANVIKASLALRAGDAKTAYTLANSVASRTGATPAVAIEALWLVVDACALNGDVECVRVRGINAVGADGNRARWARAMAALEIDGKVDPNSVTPPLDKEGMLRLAHRMSPFDLELGKRVGDPSSSGGHELALRLIAVRRAMVMNARGLATEALKAKVPEDCRVCRALAAIANPDASASARAALLALAGKGPPLSEDDLVAVVDTLGAVPIEGSEKALQKLSRDPRKSVKDAVRRAIADLKDPTARQEREKKGKNHDDHDHDDKDAKGGSVPAPH